MYKIHHSRGKSDTNFYQEQNILNGAYSGLKVLRVSIVKDLAHTAVSLKKRQSRIIKNSHSKDNKRESKSNPNNVSNISTISNSSNNSNSDDCVGERILTLVERVLLFKQELDSYFFENKIHLLKFHLNNISSIIIKNISDLQDELIKEYQILKTSHIVRILRNFSDIISTFIETKPQDLYREIKDAILNQWEKNRLMLKEFFEKIEENCNISADIEKEDMSLSLEHYEIFQGLDKLKRDSESNNISFLNKSSRITEEEENIKGLKKDEPNALYYLIKKKKEIMNFITSITEYILFSISRLYFDMDYYSIIISSLQFKIFYAIMYYIDSNKDKKDFLTELEKSRQKKVFHLINHFINLALSFNKNIETGNILLENGGLNSLSKYILNNFIEIVSKCKGLKIPQNVPKFKSPTLSQIRYKTKFYKCYLQRYKKYSDNSLLRIFMLYYNSKMTFWKSIMIVAKPKEDNKNFICRTCEKEIPLDNIFLHLGCCKEQQSFYDKMKGFKIKIQNYITHLDIFIAKSNINITPINKKLFGKGGYLHKIISKISGCENDDDGTIFIKKLIKLYTFEKNKPNDYYEKKPEELSYIVSMSYFSLMIFLLNKISIDTDQDLSEILGGIFCLLLQIFMNVHFLLYIKKSQTKNNMIKNKKKLLINTIHILDKEEKKDRNNNIFNDTKFKSSKTLNQNYNDDDSNDEDFFNPDKNFKSVIQKYKLKLSLNNMMFVNNSFNKSKTKNKARLKSPTNHHSQISFNNSNQKEKKFNFFSQKTFSLCTPKNERDKRLTQTASSTKVSEVLSNYNVSKFVDVKTSKIKKHKRSNSSISTSHKKLNLNTKTFLKLNSINYRQNGMRSLRMTRNNSSGKIILHKKNEKLNILTKSKFQKNDSSNSLYMNNIGSGINIINTSMPSETESSGEYEQNPNKLNFSRADSNLSRVDSCLSRIDSNIHRIDSNISRVDSIESHLNKNDDENSNQNNLKFILNSNNQNFQLGYRGDQIKKNMNKLSLFGSKKFSDKKISLNDKNSSFMKKKNGQNKDDSDSDSDNQSSELDDNSSDSSKGQNILVHEFEEEEINDNKKEKKNENKDENKKESNSKKSEDDDSDFGEFFKKKKDEKKNENNNENENNIIVHSSSSDSSDSKNGNIFGSNQITTKDFEDILPNMIYIKPGNQNNINYEQIAGLFNELMEKVEEKEEEKENKNNILDNRNEIFTKDFFPKKNRINLNQNHNNSNNNSNNISCIKPKDISNNKSSNNEEIQNINLNKANDLEDKKENQAKISKFKLILPIAKGGYGSVGLYKNVATSDTYAIKTVDINSMKEKKLSSSLKNEQNILKEINNDYVVNSYFIFQDKKNYYFVMEYLPGGDVYTLLSKNNLPKKTIQLIVAETILAVNYLHSINIVHHDIKPENILISLKGHFKLSDFGLSKTIQDDNEFEVTQNVRNLVEFNKFPINFSLGDDEDENKDAVGTLNYMAPELFTDKYPNGGGVDYWAIGVLIFDLFSYSLPFEADTQEKVRNNIIGIKIDWGKLINDDVKKIYGNIDPAVDLIKKFLKENPADRWGDKNLDEIKRHKFFDGFNWNDIQNIKNETIKEYVKQRIKENNNKIKQINLKNKAKKEKGEKNNEKDNNKTEDGYPSLIEINLTEDEEKDFFTERYDNLSKKNNELLKKKIAKEVNFQENIVDLMLLDLE